MRYALMISAALLMASGLGQPASAQSGPLDLVKQGVEAQGGADALRAIKTIQVKGEAKHWEPGQSYSINGESRFLGDSAFTLTADVTKRMVRVDWDRDMKYPAVEKLKYSEIALPGLGAVVSGNGEAKPMSTKTVSDLYISHTAKPVPNLAAQVDPPVTTEDKRKRIAEAESKARFGSQHHFQHRCNAD